jgi:hypothetical protein
MQELTVAHIEASVTVIITVLISDRLQCTLVYTTVLISDRYNNHWTLLRAIPICSVPFIACIYLAVNSRKASPF